MKLFLKYLINTSWGEKKSDLETYYNLWQNARAEKDFYDAARKNITCKSMVVEAGRCPPKCISKGATLFETSKGVEFHRSWKCPSLKNTMPCEGCANAVYQAEYVAAMQRMLLAYEKRKLFWRNTLNKQKGK